LGNIGQKNFDIRDNERNKMYIQKYKDLSEKIGDKEGESIALQYMGIVNASEGNYNNGIKLFEQAFEKAEDINNRRVEYISKCS